MYSNSFVRLISSMLESDFWATIQLRTSFSFLISPNEEKNLLETTLYRASPKLWSLKSNTLNVACNDWSAADR